jgi:N-methylhydantoinase B
VDLSRIQSRSWGLLGGGAGGGGALERGPGVAPFDKDQGAISAGCWFALVTPGGGGYGPAAERDQALRDDDALDGVTFAG